MSDAARRAALACVLAVVQEDAYANLVLPSLVRKRRLTGRDARFATELAYGSLRMRGFYDAVISSAARRSADDLDTIVRAGLWLGAHQALTLRTPAHAAVSETVDLVARAGGARARGLVNAVMRRITERDLEAWQSVVASGNGRDAIAIRTSHPRWVVGVLAKSLAARGRSGQLERLLNAHNEPAHVTLATRPGLMIRDELAQQTGGEPTRWSRYGVTLPGGSVTEIAAIARGDAGVQDEGSQMVATALTTHAARMGTQRERWLDMCAGPGGKTALLAGIAASLGATVDALELHPHRAQLVRDNVRNLPRTAVTVTQADATTWEGGPYDRILLDAPCTGLGALRRRPEARWRKQHDDLFELTALQRRLLARAAHLLAPGGVIAYVTCSPVLRETVDVVADSGLRQLDAREAMARATGTEAAMWGAGPDVQLWTHEHGTDSMYLALLTHPADQHSAAHH